MNIQNNYPVCKGCKFSTLHHCEKFDKICPSVNLKGTRYQLPCIDCLNEDAYEEGEYIKTQSDKKNIGYFHLPGPENLNFFRPLINMRKFYPEVFYENRVISEVYGSFAGAIWNGRTPNFREPCLTIQEIEGARKDIEELGLSLNLTWNNHLVSGTDVYDRFCNAITEVFHNGKHSITVASEELYHYLKEKYPNFKYYRSVISSECDKEFIKNDDYDYYLMNRKLNNNWDKLLEIPEEERSNIEFLCNDACTPICKRIGHYNIVNKCLLDRNDENYFIGNYCTIDHDFMFFNARLWPMTILPEHIDNYIDNGFVHFKLCSRGDNPPLLMYKIIPYLVKPEYVSDVLVWCIDQYNLSEEEALKQQCKI